MGNNVVEKLMQGQDLINLAITITQQKKQDAPIIQFLHISFFIAGVCYSLEAPQQGHLSLVN